MTDEVSERLAQRASLSGSVVDDPKLLALIGASEKETATNLQGEFTVPQLRERAERLGLPLSGLTIKEDIAKALAAFLHEGGGEPLPELPPEAEAPAAEAEIAPDGVEPEPVPPPAEPTMAGPSVDVARPVEGAGRFVQLRHVSRTLVGYGHGNGYEYLDPLQAQEHLSKYLALGYHMLFVQHLGIDPAGHMFLWAFGLPNDPGDLTPFNEVRHIVRTIGPAENAVSGFQADEYISTFLADGWELFEVKQLGLSPSGINVLWVLVR